MTGRVAGGERRGRARGGVRSRGDVEAGHRRSHVSATDPLRRAAELLADGDWQAARAIVQDDPSPLAAWMHGIVHLLEGDTSNARYWYGQARRTFPAAGAVREEVEAARAAARDGEGPPGGVRG
jgi:hypothetical protein